jgi:hypothetical protein
VLYQWMISNRGLDLRKAWGRYRKEKPFQVFIDQDLEGYAPS